jgi:hypothetical protein
LAGTETFTNKDLTSGTNSFPTFNQNTTGTSSNVTGTVAIANGGTGQTTANAALNTLLPSQTSNSGKVLQSDGTNTSWVAGSSGTVTSASVTSANGFAGTVATATTTPAITISTSVNGIAKGNGTALSAATSGTDYSAGTSALATGILKSTTTTGALSIAVAADFPTLNQNTTGNSATVTTNANLTGDVTSVGNATTLATVNSNVGTWNNVTVNGKGLVTAGSNTTYVTAETDPVVKAISGIVKSNGTTISAAVAGTDYSVPSGIETFSGAKTFNSTKLILAGNTSGTTTLNANAVAGSGTVTLPTSGTLTTTSNDLSAFAATTSAQLATVLSDETGTGSSVFSTSPTLVTPILGVANATSLGITGTGGNGFISLATQSSTPAAIGAGTVFFSNANSKFSWRGSANTFVKTFDGAAATADRLYTLPDANGTVAVSATGNIALSALGNISFTGILPIANGGTNSTATPTDGGIAYGDGAAINYSAVGTAGQVLTSNGTGLPVWKNSRTIVELPSDVISNSAANSMADVTGLSFAVTAGVTYRFKATIYYTAAATTTGSRWSVNGPASPTFLVYSSNYTLTATSQTMNNLSAYDLPATSNATSLTNSIAEIIGIVKPSANGTFIIRFASEILNSAITAKAGSTLEWW